MWTLATFASDSAQSSRGLFGRTSSRTYASHSGTRSRSPSTRNAPENTLYQEVSEFLQRDDTYSLPSRQRHLMVLLLRKILASSSTALTATLEKLRKRLEDLRGGKTALESEEKLLDDEVLDEEEEEEFAEAEPAPAIPNLDLAKLDAEIHELTEFIELAKSIKVDSKSKALLKGLSEGFQRMDGLGGPRKALIFTESKRTQAYLRHFLEANGYGGQIVLLNGTNAEPESKVIYEEWKKASEPLGRATGNRKHRPTDLAYRVLP